MRPIADWRGAAARGIERLHNPVVAWSILVLAVALTGLAWQASRRANQNAAEQRFEFRTTEIQHAIEDRLQVYEEVLWSGVAHFRASEEVSRQEWEVFVETLDIDSHWPGIQGMGYAVPVPAEEVQAHEAAIRAEGFPEYTIQPVGDRSEYTAIVYLEPFDWRNQRAFGFDMWSNEVRREAMTRARDTGRAATSGLITLVQETDEDVQRGFLTYVPVYEGADPPSTVAQRRARFQGWVYAPFRMGDLMAGILGSAEEDVAYEIFDTDELSEASLLYDSNEVFTGSSRRDGSTLERTVEIVSQGRSWTIVFESSTDYVTGSEAAQPTLIAIGGLTIDVLLFYVIWSLGLLQRRATAIAEEKTAQLQQASIDLEARAEELERSNAELAQYAFAAAHDLQEPLRTLGSYAGLLAEKHEVDFDDESGRWFNYIENSADRMTNLLRELLNYARLDTTHEEIELVGVDLEETSADVLRHLSSSVHETGATVTVGDLPIVLGDPTDLERLLQNLLSNAINHRSPERPLEVTIAAIEEGDYWRIAVRDNGIGIKAQYHERIFEIFRRVSGPKDQSGTGIGLAVCRKIVDRHGGRIGVISEHGQGSEFWFTLPRAAEGALPDSSETSDLLARI